MTRYFATRSAVQRANNDFDAAMSHQQFGPYGSETEARNALAQYFNSGVTCSHPGTSRSIAEGFVSEYLGLLTAMATNPTATTFEHDGVRWVIRSVG